MIDPKDIVRRKHDLAEGQKDHLSARQRQNLKDYGQLARPSEIFKELYAGFPNYICLSDKYHDLLAKEQALDKQGNEDHTTPIPENG